MQFPHLFTPLETSAQTAAGLGSFMFLMLTRKYGWLHVIALFFVGQVTAYYFTPQIVTWLEWSVNSYGVVGFSIGAFGMLFWGGVVSLFQSFHDDPRGTVQWILGFFGRGNGGQPNGGGNP